MPATPRQPVAGLEIKVNGARLDPKWMDMLLDVQVRDNLRLPDTAVVRLRDSTGENIDTHPLKPAAKLEILFSATDTQTVKTIFEGEIVALEPEFQEADLILAARAYDKGHRLNRHRRSKTFQNKTAEDMVRQIIGANGLSAGTLESTGATHDFFQQSMETDWDFCWRLAAMNDFEFLVEGDKAHFRKRATGSPATVLKWGEDLLTFKPRLSAAGQVSSVKVTNHDPKARMALTAQASSPKLAFQASAANQRNSLIGQLGGSTVEVADRVVTTQAEANKLAQSLLDRMASSLIEADGTAFGNPDIAAGATVKIESVGSFSGEYVLAQTTHHISGGKGYTTSFTISGRSARTIGDLLHRGGNGQHNWGSTLVIGLVTNNNDPDGMGRVRVKFETLGAAMESAWARVATLNAALERGIYMLPQPNDEVVVGFEHGDPRRPFVLGSLFNGKAKLPADLKDPSERKSLFGVKTDHEVFLDGKQKMTLKTGEKMTVEVNKNGKNATGDFLLDAKGNVEQKAVQSFKINGQTIEVDSKGTVKIKGTGSVTVEASGPLQLKGATIDVQASGPLTLKGAIINIG
jgi:phage protein D/phage baseplate assembly protein gpV